jgi:hypothetical protein
MADPRHSRTNAADSAPGVDDGRRAGGAPPVNTKPGGRRPVFLILAALLVILALVFLARPRGEAGGDEAVKFGGTQSEIQGSPLPGAVPPTLPTDAEPRP